MPSRPLILIHGYSDSSDSFNNWIKAFEKEKLADGSPRFSLFLCDYKTLTNEVSLKDIAEAFDRALRIKVGLNKGEEFDAIVHSTGMLVIRTWLTTCKKSERQGRLKHLIALAPANFGSPLAQKGRSWLGAIFKGKKWGPDFLEAGDQVLDALELGSPYTWNLAHQDLLGETTFYGSDNDTPFVFTFCGTTTYGRLADAVTPEQGSDGTVRWAGCALNTRKLCIDLSYEEEGKEDKPEQRIKLIPWSHLDTPFIPIKGLNHGSILKRKHSLLIELVRSALNVNSHTDYQDWCRNATEKTRDALSKMQPWQQFIVRVIDERGDPIPDYYIQLFIEGSDTRTNREFALDVHTYSQDQSLRCFHVNLSSLKKKAGVSKLSELKKLRLRILSTTGTQLFGYTGYKAEGVLHGNTRANRPGEWDAQFLFDAVLTDGQGRTTSFFHPFTTTLVEITLNREPYPFEIDAQNNITKILTPEEIRKNKS